MKSYSSIALASIAALASASPLTDLRDVMVDESSESLAATNAMITALVDKLEAMSVAMDLLQEDYDELSREQVVEEHFYVNREKIDFVWDNNKDLCQDPFTVAAG